MLRSGGDGCPANSGTAREDSEVYRNSGSGELCIDGGASGGGDSDGFRDDGDGRGTVAEEGNGGSLRIFTSLTMDSCTRFKSPRRSGRCKASRVVATTMIKTIIETATMSIGRLAILRRRKLGISGAGGRAIDQHCSRRSRIITHLEIHRSRDHFFDQKEEISMINTDEISNSTIIIGQVIWRKTRRSSKSSSSGTTAVAKQASSRGEYIHVHFCITMNHPMAVVSCSCVLLFLSCHTNRCADTSTTTSAIVTKQPSEWTLRLRTQMSMG